MHRLSLQSNLAFNTRATEGWSAALYAFAGHYKHARDALVRVVDTGGLDPWRAVAQALISIGLGDEMGAAAQIHDLGLARTIADRRVLSLVPAVPYVLLPHSRASWRQRSVELADVLGPRHSLSMEAAEALLRVRAGERIGPVGTTLAVQMLRTVVPMVWAMEIAVALEAEDQRDSAVTIAKLYGPPGAQWLGSKRPSTDLEYRAVQALLSVLPPRPSGRVSLSVLGNGSLRCATGDDVETVLTGGPAFEMVAYLALCGPTSRPNICAALWPERTASEAPFRDALRQVRLVTEQHATDPGFDGGGWLIRIDGDRLGLTEEPDLSIDIRDFERLIGEADQALGSSIPSRALAKLLEAIGSTEDVLLRDRNVGDWATPFRERWRDDIVSACARAAALLAASGEAQPGLQIARRALTLDAGSQIAWCAEIDARLHLGDRRGAREAARRCESELMRRGVTIDGITKEAFSRSGAGRNSSARSL